MSDSIHAALIMVGYLAAFGVIGFVASFSMRGGRR